MNRKLNFLAAILIAVAITACSSLYGQTTNWVGGGGNNLFHNGLNWSDGAPGLGDIATFLSNVPPVVNVVFDEQANRINIISAVDFALSGDVEIQVQESVSVFGKLDLINQIQVNCEFFRVEEVSTAEAHLVGSTVQADRVRIGGINGGIMTVTGGSTLTNFEYADLNEGHATVSDTGSSWTIGNALNIQRDFIMNVSSGGFVSAEVVNLGIAICECRAVLNVSGSQSELVCGGDMTLGSEHAIATPEGELNISDFGFVNVLGLAAINPQSEVSVSSNGSINVADGITNEGTITFNGPGIISGDIENVPGSELRIGPNAVGNIQGGLEHNGDEVFVASSGQLLVCGDWSGNSHFTGNGRADFEAGVSPGSSIAVVQFEGDVNFGSDVQAAFELGPGSHDQLLVDDDLTIDGTLSVNLIGGFQLQPEMDFVIMEVGGSRSGLFDGLSEGALVGNFNGVDLFITYNGGDGNDVTLFTVEDQVLLGDVNLDGQINLLDVGPFVTLLTTSQFQAEADINGDGNVNLLDVGPFVALLTGG